MESTCIEEGVGIYLEKGVVLFAKFVMEGRRNVRQRLNFFFRSLDIGQGTVMQGY
jgi:hypothetical protein